MAWDCANKENGAARRSVLDFEDVFFCSHNSNTYYFGAQNGKKLP